MPSESGPQHRFMAGCARNPEGMQGHCPPQKVAEEFLQADKGKHFGAGRKKSKGELQRQALAGGR